MLLPCSQINTCARSAFLSLRAACWKRKSLWANQGGTASYWQCLSGGLFSLACQAPLQLTAATCKQTPKMVLARLSWGSHVCALLPWDLSPAWPEKSVQPHTSPHQCATAPDAHTSENPPKPHTDRGSLHPGDGACAGNLSSPKSTNQRKLT